MAEKRQKRIKSTGIAITNLCGRLILPISKKKKKTILASEQKQNKVG